MKDHVRFLLGNELQELSGFNPQLTVLEWLRQKMGRSGTKEGCAEGDCGACTVAVGEIHQGQLRYRSFNSCIQLLASLDGKQLLTVEDLAESALDDSGLHPVQKALVEQHGSQCGFCTPGFAMSLFTLYKSEQDGALLDRQDIDEALAGNLCRCTGYIPIVRAARQAMELAPADAFENKTKKIRKHLQKLKRTTTLEYQQGERRYFAPKNLQQLWPILESYPQAQLIAGATDVGLWMTKDLRQFGTMISMCDIEELRCLQVDEDNGHLLIGAAVSYTDALQTLCRLFPGISSMLHRLGAQQVRNAGTIGGNIANGSPIGDMPPALIALRARLIIRDAKGEREIPLEDFFIEYGKQDLHKGEVVVAVLVPLPDEDQHFEVYKISKRFDQDISALCGGFWVRLQDQHVIDVRVCFGGMAGTPKRAANAEKAMLGQTWEARTIEAAKTAMAQDYEPLTDWRASAEYRSQVAQNLLQRFFLETSSSEPVQLSSRVQS